jgi:hypothetical protein
VAGRALLTLAAIEGNRFVAEEGSARADQDCKRRAREYLERITGNTREFGGTPFMTMALNAISNLNETFQVVTLAKPQPPAASTQPAPGLITTRPATQSAPGPAPAPAVEDMTVPSSVVEPDETDTNAAPTVETSAKPSLPTVPTSPPAPSESPPATPLPANTAG